MIKDGKLFIKTKAKTSSCGEFFKIHKKPKNGEEIIDIENGKVVFKFYI